MVKTPTTSPTAPKLDLSKHGFPSFMVGVEALLPPPPRQGTAALEDLLPGAPLRMGEMVTITTGSDPETTMIYKKDNAYYVYFHFRDLDADWGGNLTAFQIWLQSLDANDTIYFYQSGQLYHIGYTIQALVAIEQCLAMKIFVCDHVVDSPLFLLVCDKMVLGETGAIIFDNAVDPNQPSPMEVVCFPFIRELYERAVARGLLTGDEMVDILNHNKIVYKTARQLRSV